jgi:hypothetical protein
MKILRINETLSEAFGHRFFGFAMCALLPATYILPYWKIEQRFLLEVLKELQDGICLHT